MGVLGVLNAGRRWTVFSVARFKGVAENSLMEVFLPADGVYAAGLAGRLRLSARNVT